MLGIVVTAYRLPDVLIDRFIECNLPALATRRGRFYLVTDSRKYLDFRRENIDAKISGDSGENIQASESAKISERENIRENIRALPCPEMEIFAIGRTANIGIRQAIADGCAVICKTDIDCILDDAALADIEAVRPGQGAAYRYWHVASPAPAGRAAARMDGKIMGTVALAAADWQAVGGYDERMDGYGYDDWDIVDRARRRGIKCNVLAAPRIYHIWHEAKHNRTTINPLRRAQNIALATAK
jgi:hypothetical protein